MRLKKEVSLLDELAQAAGCTYLSDLHLEGYTQALIDAVEALPADDCFPLNQWQQAVLYITGIQQNFTTAGDAQKFLLAWLQK